MTRDALSDTLAHTVTSQYASLPSNGKPRPRTNGSPQWTVLAGFCLYRSNETATEARCVSIGTGLKALPHSKLPIHGDVLHDSHAEIIARRGLKVWLYRQLELAIVGDGASMLEKKEDESWGLREGWKLGLWISTLPCGDASTYSLSLLSSSSTPTPLPQSSSVSPTNIIASLHPSLLEASSLGLQTSRLSTSSPSHSPPLVHRGRISYSSLSTLRTKPGRADSQPTISHSCSDKIAMWSLLGVQGGLLSALGVHVKLSYVAVTGVEGTEEEREKVRGEIRRAIGGRLEGWKGPDGEEVDVPEVGLATEEFEHARNVVARQYGVKEEEVVSCQESLSWIDGMGTEVVTNGIRQGASPKRKSGEPLGTKSRSRLSKLSLFRLHLDTRNSLSLASFPSNYFETKHAAEPPPPLGKKYQDLKQAVREGPFKGWLVSGEKWESFDGEGRVVGSNDKNVKLKE